MDTVINQGKVKDIHSFVYLLKHKFKINSIETGVEVIDRHHSGFLEIIESLVENLHHFEIDKSHIKSLLTRLIAYSVEHFEYEEKLMKRSFYTDFKWHAKQHRTFNKRLNKFLHELGNEKISNTYSICLAEWLTDWFASHILEDDKKMSSFIRRKKKEKLSLIVLLGVLFMGECLIVLFLWRIL